MRAASPEPSGIAPLQTEVLHLLAHEIRTPMTTIYGAAKMLVRGGGPSAAERSEMIAAVELEADRLYRLLEDFLALAGAADSLRSVREPVLLQHVLRDVIGELTPGLRSRRIHASLPSGMAPVRGDADAVAHAARNLIESAIDATADRGVVEVVVRPGHDSIGVHVYESGVDGDASASGMFRPFDPAGATPGRGLALAASRALVEAMGGWTWAARRPDGRSETGFALAVFPRDGARAWTRRRDEARRHARPLRRRAGRRRGRASAAQGDATHGAARTT
ncbi:MAG TPA: HAMP domain-containing sensor histidine kinase [Candidatus Dormibacteraeota bacterium]|nr:HAMP domain-containing sensor histidine kinase [Candidatus Dormibacteraeota bacterium]